MTLKSITLTAILILTALFTNITGDKVYVIEKSVNSAHITVEKSQDSYYSGKKLGSFYENGMTTFRLFTPNAVKVVMELFEKHDSEKSKQYVMTRDEDAVWECTLEGDYRGWFYGYKVYHKGDNPAIDNKPLCVDPYAQVVASYNTYMTPRRSMVYEHNYDWEGDNWIEQDWRDLIVYEMHIRDITFHKSSGAKSRGTYKGLTEKGIKGGLEHIKSLGVNTVELLPAQEFANIEIPFQDSIAGRFNTWNPYERNHWGYMTAAFFAPESYYSEDWASIPMDSWMGYEGRQVNDFKDMVKSFHKEGIAVIMDVVYNHLSEYEIGNLKEIDHDYYFRKDASGNFKAESYCGNDLRTESPMLRRLIVESILFWMKEYHVDGFRFDLGKLIDWETIEAIIYEAKKINPHVVFVCEPWGGGYDPAGFSLRGWGAWNDQIRNGIKGENPNNGLGWIFGSWYGNNTPQRIRSYVNGTLIRDTLGLFQKKDHSVNYLESHDGYTLGDFIRIGSREVDPAKVITNIKAHSKLTPLQLKLNKLAALFLLTSQGITMIHSGQEFARSKVIPNDIPENDPHKGLIDHNTYDKDNAVNYIDYEIADINRELLDYYKGLISLRKNYPAFRHAAYEEITFDKNTGRPFSLSYKIEHGVEVFFLAFNANRDKDVTFELPAGEWEVLVNEYYAGLKPLGVFSKQLTLQSTSGIVLRKIK